MVRVMSTSIEMEVCDVCMEGALSGAPTKEITEIPGLDGGVCVVCGSRIYEDPKGILLSILKDRGFPDPKISFSHPVRPNIPFFDLLCCMTFSSLRDCLLKHTARRWRAFLALNLKARMEKEMRPSTPLVHAMRHLSSDELQIGIFMYEVEKLMVYGGRRRVREHLGRILVEEWRKCMGKFWTQVREAYENRIQVEGAGGTVRELSAGTAIEREGVG